MTSVSPATAPAPGQPPAAQTRPASFANGDFETFLKMLTTQIRNQDPLNPMEGSDFAVQLATFSGVEQQVRTNQLLTSLGGGLGGGGLGTYAGWIGRQVRSSAAVEFGAKPIRLDVQPEAGADRVVLVTRDARGAEVTREDIGPGSGGVDWFGMDDAGNKLPDGLYRFSIESWRGGERLGTRPVESYATVEEARIGPAGTMLILAGGAEVRADEVTAVRSDS